MGETYDGFGPILLRLPLHAVDSGMHANVTIQTPERLSEKPSLTLIK